MDYLLINKDRPIAKLFVGPNSTAITKVLDTIPSYIGDIQEWVDGRSAPIGRSNIDYLLKLAGIRNKQEFIKVTHGISLTDTFWFKSEDDNITWDKISPYKNSFSRVISEICLNGNYNYHGELKSPSPDYRVDGSVDKCWKRINGRVYLYKTAGECINMFIGIRPYMEYYASQVANQLISNKKHFVPYYLKTKVDKNGGIKSYAACPSFTSEQYGLLQYGMSNYRSMTLQEFDQSIKYDRRSREILREMLVLDSIILNHDRHDLNYGFFVDNDTYEIKGLSPIYDNDCSLGYFVSLQSVDSNDEAFREALKRCPRTEMGSYIQQANWAMTDELLNNMRNMYPFHFERLKGQPDLFDDRIKFMEYIVNRQIKSIISSIKR